ncbi:MAG TPA: OmpH family outer membrane protein [Verrucomicrobiae bacterium]|nr:OmpH family outer membrane protein [Verrucomicrobiae bacterium]
MKMKVAATITITTMALALSAWGQAATGRIVTVDLNRIFTEYYKTPIASGKLKATADSYTKEQEEMVTQYRKGVEELNKLREDSEKPEYTTEVRDQKKKAVQEKLAETQKAQRDIEEYARTHRQELEQQTARMRSGIVKEITEIIDKQAKDAGYLLVLDKSGNTLNSVPTILYSQDALDITDDVLKILNKNKPADLPTSTEKKPEEKKSDVKPSDTP